MDFFDKIALASLFWGVFFMFGWMIMSVEGESSFQPRDRMNRCRKASTRCKNLAFICLGTATFLAVFV